MQVAPKKTKVNILLSEFISLSLIYFAVIDPIGTIPIFLSITEVTLNPKVMDIVNKNNIIINMSNLDCIIYFNMINFFYNLFIHLFYF